MIRLFKSKYLFSFFYLLVVLFLVRSESWFFAVEKEPGMLTLPTNYWIGLLNRDFPFVSAIASSVIVYFQAIYLNRLVSGHQVLYKASWLPSLFLVMFTGVFPGQLLVSPQLLANVFLLITLDLLFELYKTEKPLEVIFGTGILLGTTVLLCPETIIFAPLLIIAINFFRPFQVKEILVCLMGVVLVFYFTAAAFFLADRLGMLKEISFYEYFRFNIFRDFIGPDFLVPVVVFGLFLLSALYKLNLNFRKNNIKTRKIQQLMIVYLFFSILIMGANRMNMKLNFTIFSVPLSVFIAYVFLDNKRPWLKEVLALVLVAALLYGRLSGSVFLA